MRELNALTPVVCFVLLATQPDPDALEREARRKEAFNGPCESMLPFYDAK